MALIHIYCGDGKGKTTAAVGLAVRAAGAGYHVIFAQFLKSRETSEIESLHKIPGIQVVRGEIDFPFTWELSEEEIRELREVQNAILSHMTHVKYDGDVMIVLDEVIGAYNHDFLDRNALLEQMLLYLQMEKPQHLPQVYKHK